MDSKERRLRRREQSRTIATRRLSDHLFWVHRSEWLSSNCICEGKGPHLWETFRPLSCNCRKRAHGQPKNDAGMCCCGDRRRVIRWRQQERQLRWAVWHEVDPDWDCDRLALLASSAVQPRE
jgi:hypothetical protein